MKLTIRTKLTVFTALIVSFVAVSIVLVNLQLGRRNLLAAFETEVRNQLPTIAGSLVEDVYSSNFHSLRMELASVRLNPAVRDLYVLDANGVILSQGLPRDPLRGERLDNFLLKEILASDEWVIRTERNTVHAGGQIRMPDGTRIGALLIDFSLGSTIEVISAAAGTSLYLAAFFVLCGIVLAGVSSRFLTRPILTLLNANERIAEGKLDTRVEIMRQDELGILARSTNRMAEALERTSNAAKQAEAEVRDLNKNLEIKIAERTSELEQANHELMKANQLQADFTAMIVHDLRAPMSNVIAVATMMEDGFIGDITGEQKRWIAKIKKNAEGLVALVGDYLDVSKLEAGRIDLVKQPSDLNILLNSAADNFLSVSKERRIALTCRAGALPIIEADPQRLEQVLNNLLSNALKFTPEGGAIELAASIDGDEAKIRVIDNGVGIPSGEIGMVFEKYKQSASGRTSKHKGTGLGLVICKMIVEAHGGKIRLESREGNGTTAEFTIPLRSAASREAKPAPEVESGLAA